MHKRPLCHGFLRAGLGAAAHAGYHSVYEALSNPAFSSLKAAVDSIPAIQAALNNTELAVTVFAPTNQGKCGRGLVTWANLPWARAPC